MKALHLTAVCLLGASGGWSFAAAADDDDEDEASKPRYEVTLVFEGNSAVASPDLRIALSALVADLRRAGVDDSAVEDAVYLVERYYASRGFPSAVVAAQWASIEGGFSMTFRIREGLRTYLGELRFSGNLHLDDAVLHSCFAFEREILGLGRAVFTRSALDDGLEGIAALYRIEGYWFVQVNAQVGDDDPARIDVDVRIDEGSRILLREPIALSGVEAFRPEEIEKVVKMKLPVPFTPRLPTLIKGRVLNFYRTRGYRSANVKVHRVVDPERGRVDITLEVKEGPRTHVAEVQIKGNEDSWDSVVRRYIKLRPSDLYNADRIRESYRGLLRSGLFESASIEEIASPGRPDEVTLRVRVEEKPPWSISTLVGYGSWEQLRGTLSVENLSVLGSGHRIRVQGGGSFKGESADVEYMNPFFFHERLAQDSSGFYERREQRSYESRDTGAEVGLGLRITDHLRSRLFHQVRQSELLEVVEELPPELTEDVFLSSIHLVNTYDTRTNFINPASGLNLRISLEYAGEPLGSDLDYLRSRVGCAWVWAVTRRVRWVTSGRVGVIGRLPGTDVIPIQERFFAGGDDTIRSYREDKAGPMIDGAPVGGESVLIFNSEIRSPLPYVRWSWLDELDLAIFADAGTVNARLEDFGGGRYYFALGTGLRYNTPVGPLRVDLAFNPDRDPGEDLFVFHFGLGYPF